jgi:hypothetical protein
MASQSASLKKILASIKKIFVTYKIAVFVVLVLIPVTYIGVMFYFYAWQVGTPEELPTKNISIDNALYQKTIDNLNQREINFAQEETKTYLDPFYK